MNRRSRAAAGAATAIALLLSGCTAPLPQVSFYGHRAAVSTEPALWCTTDAQATGVDCRVDKATTDPADEQATRLTLGRGDAVSVNVPSLVSDAPWVVLFQYSDAAGEVVEARSPLFSSEAQHEFVLRPPADDDQLLRVEVQAGLTPVATDTGTGVDYAALRTWVLVIDPAT